MCHVACPPSNPWNGWIVTADNRWIYERHGRLHSALSANEIYGGRFCTVSPLWLAQTRLTPRSVDSVLPICGYLHVRNFRRVLKCPVLNRFQKFPSPRVFSKTSDDLVSNFQIFNVSIQIFVRLNFNFWRCHVQISKFKGAFHRCIWKSVGASYSWR